jgi:hypothetical protein
MLIGRNSSDLTMELMNIWNRENSTEIKNGKKGIVMDVEQFCIIDKFVLDKEEHPLIRAYFAKDSITKNGVLS